MPTPTPVLINNKPHDASVLRMLELHADFACGNCGLCCRNAWAVHVEPEERQQMGKNLKGHGWTEEEIARHFPADPNDPTKTILASLRGGICVFNGSENNASCCMFQKAFGHQDLPGICQAFPRLAIATPAGIYLTLSYTCPTAVRLLLKKDSIREATPRSTLRAGQKLVGIDIGASEKPPVFTGKVRPDWQAFDYFWRWTPEWIANPALTPAEALFGLGTVIEAIESIGEQAASLNVMIDLLDQALAVIPQTVKQQASQKTPQTELGVIYLETLINIMRQTGSYKRLFKDLCSQPQFGPELFRAALASEYDRIVRPCLPEFELIERNFVASRLFANPMAWRVKQLRTGYFVSVLSLIALRFSVLAICLLEGRTPDQEVWLRAADNADFVLLHSPFLQQRFLDLLEENIQGEIRDLAAPALF